MTLAVPSFISVFPDKLMRAPVWLKGNRRNDVRWQALRTRSGRALQAGPGEPLPLFLRVTGKAAGPLPEPCRAWELSRKSVVVFSTRARPRDFVINKQPNAPVRGCKVKYLSLAVKELVELPQHPSAVLFRVR